MVTLRAALVTVLALTPAAASAAQATVSVKIADMRVQPDSDAFARLRIPGGRQVAVLGKSDDGAWVKIRTKITKADEEITLEGWLPTSDLKGDFSGVAVASGSSGPKKSSAATPSAWADDASASGWGEASSSASSDGWGDSGSSSSGWGDSSASSSSSAWGDTTSSSSASSSSDMGEWNFDDASSSSSSSSSSDSGWGDDSSSSSTSSDSGWGDDSSSSSSSSGDEWDSGSSSSDDGW